MRQTPSAGSSPAITDPLVLVAGGAFVLWVAAGYWTVAPMSISVGLVAASAFLCMALRRGAHWKPVPLDGAAIGWALALLLSASFALDRAASFPRLTKALFPFLVGLAAWHASDERVGRRAVAALLLSASGAALFGIILYLVHGRWFPIRARGPVGHYVTYAGQMAIAASVGLAVALRVREPRWRWLGATTAITAAVALALTYTRGSWMGLGLGAALMLALIRPRGLFVLAAAAVATLALAPASIRTRLFSSFDPSNALWNGQRLFMWDAGWRMFRDHPVTGVGLQDLHALYDRYKAPGAWEPAGHLHSVPVQVGATMGVVGLVAVVALYATMGFMVFHLHKRVRRADLTGALALAAMAAFVSFAFAGLFEWNLGDEEVLHPLYALLGFAWGARKWQERGKVGA